MFITTGWRLLKRTALPSFVVSLLISVTELVAQMNGPRARGYMVASGDHELGKTKWLPIERHVSYHSVNFMSESLLTFKLFSEDIHT